MKNNVLVSVMSQNQLHVELYYVFSLHYNHYINKYVADKIENTINQYLSTKMFGILCTRFTDETYAENLRFRERTGIKCIYSEQRPISNYLPECLYFVIEMNNSTNEIMGIGVIENKLQEKMKVYENPYNRYVYKGDMHIPISSINPQIVEELENILFYGKGHSKRGSGITMFPSKKLKPEFIREFKSVHSSLQKSCP